MISRYVLQKWAKKPKKFISYLNNYALLTKSLVQ